MKRIPLILSLHASAEKDGVDSSTAIQEAAPSEAPHRKPPRRTAPSLPPPLLPPLPSPSVVLSTPMIFPSPTASSRRFTAI